MLLREVPKWEATLGENLIGKAITFWRDLGPKVDRTLATKAARPCSKDGPDLATKAGQILDRDLASKGYRTGRRSGMGLRASGETELYAFYYVREPGTCRKPHAPLPFRLNSLSR